jgi:DNA-binding transcriptional regulator YiaG
MWEVDVSRSRIITDPLDAFTHPTHHSRGKHMTDPRTPAGFKEMRQNLFFSQAALADEWNMGKNGGRTIRRWENGDVPVNPIAAYAIAMMTKQAGT